MEHLGIKRVSSISAVEEAAQILLRHLTEQHFFSSIPNCVVLSGGSCVDVALAFVKALPPEASLHHTTVLLADERWVEPGSADSNEYQLREKGVVRLLEERGARFVSVLGQRETPQTTLEELEVLYKDVLSASKSTSLLAGVGPDGHTAGMLPETNLEAFLEKFSTGHLLSYYQLAPEQDNPFRERITITLTALSKISDVVIYAVGENKKEALIHLKNKESSLHQTPALGLYMSPGSVTLITDVPL